MTPDRDVRPFQYVLLDLGARLQLPGMTREDGSPKFPGGYPDYIVNHERRPGIGPLAGYRGKNGGDFGKGDVNPRQLEQYIADGCFHVHHLPEHMRFFRHVNRDYIEWALDKGFRLTPTPVIFQLYSEPMQKMRLAARGHGSLRPPEHPRAADAVQAALAVCRGCRLAPREHRGAGSWSRRRSRSSTPESMRVESTSGTA